MKNRRASFSAQQVPIDAIFLQFGDKTTLPGQLYGQLKRMILQGSLKAGTALPPSRLFARDLGVGRNTVIAAYDQLASEGYIDSRERSRSFVANLSIAPRPSKAKAEKSVDLLSKRGRLMASQPLQAGAPRGLAFHPGTPDFTQFPFDKWRRLLANRLVSQREDLFGYHYITGYPGLKASIADYLQSSRRVNCEASQIVITTGAQAALDLLARLLLDPGDDVWMEEPGYLGAQSAFLGAGANLSPLHVNAEGWEVARLPRRRPKVIYLTPSCQSPLGVTMRMEQRLNFLDLANQWGSWVIEDDFDSEYRFSGQPIPSMQGEDSSGRTIYVGTFAKTLMPSLRLGFMVLPPGLLEAFFRASNATGQYAPLVLQAALADFMDRGFFAQHLRRMRRLYARRRETFIELCRANLGTWLRHTVTDTGMQTLWYLDKSIDDRKLAEAGAKLGLVLAPLSQYFRHGRGQPGLVLGYAALDESAMQSNLKTLRGLLQKIDSEKKPKRRRFA
jgi:GntR family transcriptional regulator/MocR family aminotransferase